MNKHITLISALAASLLASFAVQAADTAELKVKGVIRPSACTPGFTGGGVVDYGTISVKTLSATAATVLDEKTVPFSITCDAATKVAVTIIDNRAPSMVAGLLSTLGGAYIDSLAFGLGTAGGKNIGVYSVRLVPGSFTGDSTSPDVLTDNVSNSGSWLKSDMGNGTFGNSAKYRKAFAAAGTTAPAAFKTLTGTLGVRTVIDKTSNLDLTGNVPLDGSATIEVQYL